MLSMNLDSLRTLPSGRYDRDDLVDQTEKTWAKALLRMWPVL